MPWLLCVGSVAAGLAPSPDVVRPRTCSMCGLSFEAARVPAPRPGGLSVPPTLPSPTAGAAFYCIQGNLRTSKQTPKTGSPRAPPLERLRFPHSFLGVPRQPLPGPEQSETLPLPTSPPPPLHYLNTSRSCERPRLRPCPGSVARRLRSSARRGKGAGKTHVREASTQEGRGGTLPPAPAAARSLPLAPTFLLKYAILPPRALGSRRAPPRRPFPAPILCFYQG